METPLRVLFVNRPTITSLPGGDVVQMEETKKELERLGVEVVISTSLAPDASGYDLVHLFNLETPEITLGQAQAVKKQGKPTVLSTIYWDMGNETRFRSFFEFGRWRSAKKILGRNISHRIFQTMYGRTVDLQNKVLQTVEAILPNSSLEEQQIRKNFQLPKSYPAFVVTNGVRPETVMGGRAQRFENKYGVTNFLLEVARLGFIKNQLNLLKALRDWKQPIVFIGQEPEAGYARACRREARGRSVIFIPHLPPEQLKDAYAAALVHVLPSQKETVGLVSLEAGLAGCRIVASRVGGQPEYLQNWAEYCDPNNLPSIRQAIERAWESPVNPGLAQHIKQNYTWPQAAAQTLAAYRTILKR